MSWQTHRGGAGVGPIAEVSRSHHRTFTRESGCTRFSALIGSFACVPSEVDGKYGIVCIQASRKLAKMRKERAVIMSASDLPFIQCFAMSQVLTSVVSSVRP